MSEGTHRSMYVSNVFKVVNDTGGLDMKLILVSVTDSTKKSGNDTKK